MEVLIRWQRVTDLILKEMNVSASFIMQINKPYMSIIIASKIKDNPYIAGHQFELKGTFSE